VADSDFAAYRFAQPLIAIGVSDIRGIESPLSATLNGAPLQLLPGTGTGRLPGGIHAAVSSSLEDASHLQLVLDLPLLGTSTFHILPVGKDTQIHLKSNWPDPSFTGNFLPAQHRIDAGGFTAHWATSFFSTNLEEVLHRCGDEGPCMEFMGRSLGVSFVNPVDHYLKADRAVKYALLFIILTFAGFFLFDVMKRLPIHPIQYGFVGAGLALFYLLLLSLSEHVGFNAAYLLSSAACVGLISFYVSHVLQSFGRGLGFGCGLAVLYAALFGLVISDDYALLMGSLLLFALLGAAMVLTRNVDWSKLSAREASSS
jgi:inner membrane protein